MSFQEKKKLLPTWFLVQFACTINCAGKLICLCACLHKCDRAGLNDKPVSHSMPEEPYICDCGTFHHHLWYTSLKWWYLQAFFFKILIFLVGRRSKGKKWPKLTKNSVCCCALCLRNHTSEGLIQRFLGGSSSMKNNGHNCDQALIKNSWESV